MIVFDIDGTLSPTREEEAFGIPGETAEAFGFQIFIPQHLLDFLRGRDDIALLSTWDAEAASLAEAFAFKAQTLLISDYSDERGINGKFDVINELKPTGWADDHIKPFMATWCKPLEIAVTIPKRGFVTEPELSKFVKSFKES